MKKENLDQDLGWAPTQYPQYNSFESGQWRIVVDDSTPVGIIYTNNAASAGVIWIKQTDLVMEMRKRFFTAAQSGMSASDAYGAVESKYDSNLQPTQTGTMDGVNDAFSNMMNPG